MSALSLAHAALAPRRRVDLDPTLADLLGLAGHRLAAPFASADDAPSLALFGQDPVAMVAPVVAEFEGFRASPYLCPARVWTIGCGTITWPDGRPVRAGDGPITRAQALALLRHDLEVALAQVRRLVRVPLTEGQTAALVSFTHNLGPGNLGGSTLLRLLNRGDYAGAAAQFPRWNMGGGKVLPGLVRRRKAEREMFESQEAISLSEDVTARRLSGDRPSG